MNQSKYAKLPLGSIKAGGWLKDQLIVQKNGLSDYIDQCCFHDEWWKTPAEKSEAVEACRPHLGWHTPTHFTPDWLIGLVGIAYALDDDEIKRAVKEYVDHILGSLREDGSFGPPDSQECSNTVNIGRSKAMLALISYCEASKDARVIEFLLNHFKKYLDKDTRGKQYGWFNNTLYQEAVSAGIWLYNKTEDEVVLDVTGRISNQQEPEGQWVNSFLNGRPASSHGYPVAHAIKYPAFIYLLTGNSDCKKAVDSGLAFLEKEQGQIGGRFTGHEFLADRDGRNPTNGSELCHVVELAYSLEKLFEIFGDPKYAEQAELLLFNSFPAACTGDMWAHQYDQQSNQVLCTAGRRRFDNSETANLFGLKPHYQCCLGNMHHAWPRLVEHQWMATEDGGVIAMSYCPCSVSAKVADGCDVRITVESDYPFEGEIDITVALTQPASFPVHLRIPSFTGTYNDRTVVKADGKAHYPDPGTIFKLEKQWNNGDRIHLSIPMVVKCEKRSDHSIAVKRGPLYFALRVGEEYRQTGRSLKGSADWEIIPTTPWNVALFVNFKHTPGTTVTRHPISRLPFAHEGEMIYNPEKDCHEKWTEREPVVITMDGRLMPGWGIHPLYSMADDIPVDTAEYGPPVKAELIPYGCSNLRIAEFPYII